MKLGILLILNANAVNFRSFTYKAKLLGNTEGDEVCGILRDATIAVTWKYVYFLTITRNATD